MTQQASKSNRIPSKNEWICLHERTVLSSPVVEVVERECRSSEDDRTHRFFVMRSNDWCNIIPVTEDGKIVLVKQFRIGIDEHTLEIPGGMADAEDRDLQTAALREMTEETGYVPTPEARCVSLGWCYPNPAILNNRSHFFVVGPVRLEKKQELDHGEMIEVLEVPCEKIPEMIERGEITHALTLNAFFRLALGAGQGQAQAQSKGQGSDALTSALSAFSQNRSSD